MENCDCVSCARDRMQNDIVTQIQVDNAINLLFRGNHFTVVCHFGDIANKSFIGDVFEFVRIEGNFLLGRPVVKKNGSKPISTNVRTFDLNTYEIQFFSLDNLPGEYVRKLTGRMPNIHPAIKSRQSFFSLYSIK